MALSWKQYLPLLKKKQRMETGKCLVEGVRLCQEALLSGWEIEAAFVTARFAESDHWTNFEDTFRHRKIPWRELAEAHFNRLCDTDTPQGIVMVLKIPLENLQRPNYRRAKFVLLLESVRDPGNLGTLIRTADWYGVSAIVLSNDCVDTFNPKVLRSSMGSVFHLPVFTCEDLAAEIGALKENHFWIVAASVNGKKTLQSTHFKRPVALVLGNEAYGISPAIQQHADMTVKIWKYGQAESLNVSIAGGVFLHHIAAQIFPKGKTKG